MVRLKEAILEQHKQDSIFQFLMVRLKVRSKVHISGDMEISIPYGSIKSKSLSPNAFKINTFQFLMVRLKANWN